VQPTSERGMRIVDCHLVIVFDSVALMFLSMWSNNI
jgi:hypothetical protein